MLLVVDEFSPRSRLPDMNGPIVCARDDLLAIRSRFAERLRSPGQDRYRFQASRVPMPAVSEIDPCPGSALFPSRRKEGEDCA